LITKKILVVAMLCVLSLAIAPAQDTQQAEAAEDSTDTKDLIKQASFSIETDQAIFNFVLVNNKTADALFSGPSKYRIRAIASTTTVFYVHGIAKKNINFKPIFDVMQNSMQINTKLINIKNFEDGSISEGTKIEGLVQLVRKLNLYQPFTIKDAKNSYELEYTWDAIELLES